MIGLWLNGIKPWGRECGKHILEREASNAGTIHEEGQATFRPGMAPADWDLRFKDRD